MKTPNSRTAISANTNPLSNTNLSSPSFHERAYTYLTTTHKTDNLSVAYIRESTCAYCFIDNRHHTQKPASSTNDECPSCASTKPNPRDQEQERVWFLSELECELLDVEGWRRGDSCWCGGVERRAKERLEKLERIEKEKIETAEKAERERLERIARARAQIFGMGGWMRAGRDSMESSERRKLTEKEMEIILERLTEEAKKEREVEVIRDWTTDASGKPTGLAKGNSNAAHNDAEKEEVEDFQRSASAPVTPTPSTPTVTTTRSSKSSPESPTSSTTRPKTFPVPRPYALKSYEWEQKPGLDGYNADQEREERFAEEYDRYFAKVEEEREEEKKRMRERELERQRIIGSEHEAERERERGRQRERTGYGVPYNNAPDPNNRPRGPSRTTGIKTTSSVTYASYPHSRSGYTNPFTGVPIPSHMLASRHAHPVGSYASYHNRNGTPISREPHRTRTLDRYVGTGTGSSSYISASRSASYAGTGAGTSTGTGTRSSYSSSYIAPTPPKSGANSVPKSNLGSNTSSANADTTSE